MMFGYVLGTFAIFGVGYLIGRRRGWWYGRMMSGAWGAPWRTLGPRGLLRGVFYRLETSPAQEKVIVEVVEGLMSRFKEMRSEVGGWRQEVGAVMGEPSFDPSRVDTLFDKQRGQLDPLQVSLREALARIHEVLDDTQRKKLGQLLQAGGWAHPLHGGWRRGWHGAAC